MELQKENSLFLPDFLFLGYPPMPRAKSGRCRARAQDGKSELEFVFTKDGKS
jgi:hypothetical protein